MSVIGEDLKSQTGAGTHTDEIFKLVVEAAPNAIVLTNAQGRILLVNAGAEKLFGHTRGDLIGQPVETLLPKRFRTAHPGYHSAYAAHAEARPMGSGRDLFALRQDGSEVPVEIGLNPIETPEGTLILAVIIDITDRKQADDALRASLKEIGDLKAALDEHAIVAITDPQGRITFVNDKFCAISKYSREELIGQDHRIINSGYHPTEFIRDLWTTITHGRVWHGEIKNRAKDGSFYWVDTTIVPFLNDQGKPRQYVAIRADITERKLAEEARRTSEGRYRTLFECAPDGILIADPDSYYIDANASICQMLGYTREELIGLHASDIVTEQEVRHIEPALDIIKKKADYHREWQFRRKNGSVFAAEVIATALPDGNLLGMIRDVTERKEAETKIHQLNAELEQRVAQRTAELQAANKELEAFSYSVSHDLRAPLRAVDGFSLAVLEDYGPQLPEEGRHYLETIRHGAQKMGALIDDLLTFSRLSRAPLNKQKVNTAQQVRDVLEDLGPQRNGREIDMRIGDLPPCEGDPALLKQIWANLLSNALKYTQKRELTVVEIGFEPTPKGDAFFVRDNGTGFDMRYANKLFGVFQRLHRAEDYEGTGVGLAIVQRIIHRHGGQIWAEAAVNRGATFYFTLKPKSPP